MVENVAGAGGTIGSTRAARATADGYTIQIGQAGTHVSSVGLFRNLRLRRQSNDVARPSWRAAAAPPSPRWSGLPSRLLSAHHRFLLSQRLVLV
ncbi:hypothetical protein GWE18_34685 [Bradyrhizobium sp. CSA112]|uniref:tripartite tricarboxylate transporter substrate-binding protein n=1 Tax=Bradyrhizobium sp. CSA112 TaxID=2699170 RepID=UPI0023B1A6B8|nr:tripartite tricarboxylate transporter substrate-binding protein [Bradyrhizobium sp. CSA112]MDE5457872.1 hypothetical protein [Bradyrhizobium sp. CSA112]